MKEREIKFRAWNKKNGQHMVDLKSITPFALADSRLKGLFIPDEPDYEIMQYVGLKDRHGKDVYEGDVDASNKHGFRVVVWDPVQLCYVLLWTKYYPKWLKVGSIANCGCTYEKVTAKKKLNIVGNIYQHLLS